MNKNHTKACLLISSLTLISSINAFAQSSLLVPIDVSLGLSERQDSLNWSIAGSNVNILSELEWSQLHIRQIQANATVHLPQHLNLAIDIQRGSIYSGKNTDSDYNGNNRTLPFSRATGKGGGKVNDWSIGLGKEFIVAQTIHITPSIGWSQHQQNLTMTQGLQIIPDEAPYYGAFSGLNNSYNTQWQGMWLGITGQFALARQLTLSTNIRYHKTDYTAAANWNLRNEFMHPLSFEHYAKGLGRDAAVTISYLASARTTLQFLMQYQKWQTSIGQDNTYFLTGTTLTYVLNHVNWRSQSYGLSLLYKF